MRRVNPLIYLGNQMKIENPLLTGTTLEALKFQATILASTGANLATESATSEDKKKAMNPFLGFVSRIKNFNVNNLTLIPRLKDFIYKPHYNSLDRFSKVNFGTVRSMIVPSIPDSHAMVKDYLSYLDELGHIVQNVITDTIPGCKEYFSGLLEDVNALASSSQASAIDRLHSNQFALENLNKKFPGIIKRNDDNLARAPLSTQYTSMRDFIDCQEYLAEISKYASTIKVDEASRKVKEMNEIISRVIMKVKQTKDVEIDASGIQAISTYLYRVAEEITLIPAFTTHLQMAIKVLEEQVEFLNDQTGITG